MTAHVDNMVMNMLNVNTETEDLQFSTDKMNNVFLFKQTGNSFQ